MQQQGGPLSSRGARGLRTPAPRRIPMQGPSRRGPMTPFERWFSALFALGLLAAFVAVILKDFEAVRPVPGFVLVLGLLPLPLSRSGPPRLAPPFVWCVGPGCLRRRRPPAPL